MAQDDEFTTTEELEDLRRQLILAFREENYFSEQKNKDQWHKDGDRNTKFHHATTKQRRAQNQIVSIKDKHGKLVESEIEVENVAVQQIFSRSFLYLLANRVRHLPPFYVGNGVQYRQ